MAEYLKCNHPEKAQAVRFIDQEKAGRWYFLQCQICGEKIKRLSVAEVNKSLAEPLDENIRRSFFKRSLNHFEQERAKEKQDFDKWYSDYLVSPEWKEKRNLVFMRANGLCEGCMKNRATEVHHLTYDHVGNELLFELVAICSQCHNSIHQHT